MTLRRGESLLLTVFIPVVLLVFFSEVHLLPTGTAHPVTFLAPGILALAVMGTAMVNLSIATGFERGYGVLKRLGATPLGRPSLLGAKIAAILVIEGLQAVVLVPVALGLGWHPTVGGAGAGVAVVVLATAGFGGIGLLLAGTLRAEVNLAAANGLWLALLLVSGMLAPLSKLPGGLQAVAKALPPAALAEALHDALGAGTSVPGWAWAVPRGGPSPHRSPPRPRSGGSDPARGRVRRTGARPTAPAHRRHRRGRGPGPGMPHRRGGGSGGGGPAGAVLVCGGLGGVMAAACRGARAEGGLTVGILPGPDRAAANAFVDVAVPTGMGEARNAVVVRCADAVVAVGGEFGTLSEIAPALQAGTPVVGIGTWELAKAGTVVDAVVPRQRRRRRRRPGRRPGPGAGGAQDRASKPVPWAMMGPMPRHMRGDGRAPALAPGAGRSP